MLTYVQIYVRFKIWPVYDSTVWILKEQVSVIKLSIGNKIHSTASNSHNDFCRATMYIESKMIDFLHA